MTRERLPDRRSQESFTMRHRLPRGGSGGDYILSVGRFADGRIAEVFLTPPQSANDSSNLAHDVAVIISIALQHGVSIEEMRLSVGREEDEARTPQSIAGAVLDALQKETR